MFIDEEGILHIKMKAGMHVGLQDTIEYYEAARQLTEGRKALVLIDGRAEYTISQEAKAFAHTREASRSRLAVAYVTSSTANKLMFNFYVMFQKPPVPTLLFSSEKKALEWLRSFFVMPGDIYRKPKKS
jgi:hypothetical protein